MTEAAISAPVDLSADLDRIEAAVQAGNTDLKALGFWRLVAHVKPDRLLVDRYADQIGRIDGGGVPGVRAVPDAGLGGQHRSC